MQGIALSDLRFCEQRPEHRAQEVQCDGPEVQIVALSLWVDQQWAMWVSSPCRCLVAEPPCRWAHDGIPESRDGNDVGGSWLLSGLGPKDRQP